MSLFNRQFRRSNIAQLPHPHRCRSGDGFRASQCSWDSPSHCNRQDVQRTVDFYVATLGLRFVKKTVNVIDRKYFRSMRAVSTTVSRSPMPARL